MERIELIHVNKKLGGKEVLKGVDLTLEEGKLYGIIGENGSGKTMLLRLLAGLIHPDDGEVHYGGKKVKKLTQVVNIGLSIENIGLYDDMTVYQNMKYYAKLSGGCDKKKIEETLQRMGLTDRKNMRFAKLSLGLKQKAVLAQAILSSPDLLLLDEPTNGLDTDAKDAFKKVVLEEVQRGCTVVVVSHDHTFATRAIENGMQPKTLQKILGHGSLQMTMDLYCHVTEDTLFTEMMKMEKAV